MSRVGSDSGRASVTCGQELSISIREASRKCERAEGVIAMPRKEMERLTMSALGQGGDDRGQRKEWQRWQKSVWDLDFPGEHTGARGRELQKLTSRPHRRGLLHPPRRLPVIKAPSSYPGLEVSSSVAVPGSHFLRL